MSLSLDDDRVNMVPMIDTMLFLILFFMLVTRFGTPDLQLSALIPSTGGAKALPAVDRLPAVTIAVYPSGAARGRQPSWYQTWWNSHRDDGGVSIRIGGSEALVLDAAALRGGEAAAGLDRLHAYVERELALREQPGVARGKQPEIEIAAFSLLPWGYAAGVLDAVRAYELAHGGTIDPTDPRQRADGREVHFSAPRIHHWTPQEDGEELYEVVNQR